MKRILKPLGLFMLATLIIIQFFHPEKNVSTSFPLVANDISSAYHVPDNVQKILQTSCFDCHSNNTKYPWYSKIQPVAWWLADHIKEGKKELDFSEFASYRIGRQYKKLEEINEQIKEGEMPLTSYTLIHTNAKLDEQQKLSIANWVTALRDSIKAHYPEDSLKRPQKPKQAPTK
ncbi:MAG: heme-binding domain-containing protein [Ferruginibacter sp.]